MEGGTDEVLGCCGSGEEMGAVKLRECANGKLGPEEFELGRSNVGDCMGCRVAGLKKMR